jgi:hypothetical protein
LDCVMVWCRGWGWGLWVRGSDPGREHCRRIKKTVPKARGLATEAINRPILLPFTPETV